MSKPRLVSIVLFAACIFYILIGVHFRSGKVMATSRNSKIPGQPTIKIREIRSFPVWAFPLASLDDNPQYRFEYYQYSYPQIWSCESYVGKSYKANSAQIEWTADGTATAFLDYNPTFICKNGVWRAAIHP